MKTSQDIFEKIKEVLVELFEIDEADITLKAHLYHDLDIDSIDAVDLIVKLKEITGKKINPEDFKKVRTVQDVVTATQNVLSE